MAISLPYKLPLTMQKIPSKSNLTVDSVVAYTDELIRRLKRVEHGSLGQCRRKSLEIHFLITETLCHIFSEVTIKGVCGSALGWAASEGILIFCLHKVGI